MNVFDKIRDKVLSLFDNSGWIKWIHPKTMPAHTSEMKQQNIEYSKESNHCATCLNLNGCCFPKNNLPVYPHHYGCHCRLETATNINFKAECPIEKFTDYIFDPNKNRGKKALFESWGYDKIDAELLQQEYCRQAQKKYAKGEFVLNKLDEQGQRINIEITLPNKYNGENITFLSGWMVYPDGKIRLATPFAGGLK
ncbi:MAG: DUF6883 domain-containing protein [Candidatus Fimimonas sp.]